ncbi:hypothetical protein EE612_009257 [Oryza sativa]|nr:hypothetical protein EE612_009257 [Oryza sativa]
MMEALWGISLRSPNNLDPSKSRTKVIFFTPMFHPLRALPILPPNARHNTW